MSQWDFGMRQDIGISAVSVGLKGMESLGFPCVSVALCNWDLGMSQDIGISVIDVVNDVGITATSIGSTISICPYSSN